MSQSIPEYFFEKLKNQELDESDHLMFTEWLKIAPEDEVDEVLEKYSWYFQNQPDAHYPENSNLVNLIESKLDEIAPPVQEVDRQERKVMLSPFVMRISIAASLLVGVCLFYYYFNETRPSMASAPIARSAKIVPGGNKAILTLSNGNTITLDSAHNGMLASQNSVQVIKKKNGQLVYDASAVNQTGNEVAYNTITTPRGGQYQIQLPDGSKVWLNAESSLRFPAHFTGTRRLVTLTGEGYFEVAKDKAHPFTVDINNMEVEVLGTHFDIMGYKDEAATATTLLEGAVKIKKGNVEQMIVPGQQAKVNQDITVANVNVNEAVEWKNGNFNFSHEKLESIMRKIARWYDVDVAYSGKVTNATFVGTIPRSEQITEVLKYLELTGLVHFKITERRITAMP
ncbi:FecR family protein [Mucilaginibacter sp. SMC90]|uniref:FecR family protein n=1 Tax=Mucilaginibacter sp. SMC90 TaxID=2929803 RepID=UPI001FB2EC46|nr:FecR family protein [Mucilaginibacter sp. SMC90]UOE47502.1 FecR family protein [Mucilaginibacter sp. SMC90]